MNSRGATATLDGLPQEMVEQLVAQHLQDDPFAFAALRQTCRALRAVTSNLGPRPITLREAFVRLTGTLARHLGDKRRAHWEARARRAVAELAEPPAPEDLIARRTTPELAFINRVGRMRALLRVGHEVVEVAKRGYTQQVKKPRAWRQTIWRHGTLVGLLRAYGVLPAPDEDEDEDVAEESRSARHLWQLLAWLLRAGITPPLAVLGAGVEDTILPWMYTLRLRLPEPVCHSVLQGTLVDVAAGSESAGCLHMQDDRTLSLHCDETEMSADEWRDLLFLCEARLLAAADLLRAELAARRPDLSPCEGEALGFRLLPSFHRLRERFRELLLRLDGLGAAE